METARHAPRPRRSPLAMVVLALLEEAPSHAYRMQQLIRERGKDSVVNVGSRNSIHQVLDRLVRDEQITQQPSDEPSARVVYRITDAGRRTLDSWLTEMLTRPRNEYPDFPAALAFAVLFSSARLADLLAERIDALDAALAEPDPVEIARQYDLHRVFLIEDEYKRAMVQAERDWVNGLLADLRSGALTWPAYRSAGVSASAGGGTARTE